MGTPKEVVINEMVEFGKRYGDESSFKLLNGIAHKLFTPDE
jgi:transcription termination factor NusB